MVDALGGAVKGAGKREYGFAELVISKSHGLFKDIDKKTKCWMSHGDSVEALPKGFDITASTENTEIAAIAHQKRNLYGLQFHPEVEHTPEGKTMLANFLSDVCGCKSAGP